MVANIYNHSKYLYVQLMKLNINLLIVDELSGTKPSSFAQYVLLTAYLHTVVKFSFNFSVHCLKHIEVL
jgi:hypothetical protein